MTVRRGLTLIELLVAITMLALIVVVCVSWMTTILRSQAGASREANWARASSRLLDAIELDVLTIDRLDTDAQRSVPRIVVEDSSLSIRSRDGSGINTFSYSSSQSGELYRTRSGERRREDQVPLLGETTAFDCQIYLSSEERASPSLLVTLTSQSGRHASRTIPLQREDVQ